MSDSRDKVLVAMSGGVDSSVAAALLQQRGHSVIGVFMSNGIQAAPGRSHRQGCCSVDDAMDARRVADQLDIPFYAVNLAEGFRELIDDFTKAYVKGRTPNPCIECNRRFKLGALLDLARRLGASMVATGHYASIVERDGRYAIEQALDLHKDQSYLLFPLGQEALGRTSLPLGGMSKVEVRAEARRLGLRTAEKPESMEICFVPSGDYRDLVRSERAANLEPGPIVDASGAQIGEHDGVALFTVGQRRGLPGGQERPLYVTRLDPATATVTVGPREGLLQREFCVEELVWSGAAPAPAGSVLEGHVKIRHRHPGAAARLRVLDHGRAEVAFVRPQTAVTPGQAAVLYQGGRILVGGWIAAAQEAV